MVCAALYCAAGVMVVYCGSPAMVACCEAGIMAVYCVSAVMGICCVASVTVASQN